MPATLQPHRTWGTRYDSLVDAVPVPSPSPPSLRGSSNINNTFHTCQHDNSMSNIAHVQSMHSATSTASFPLHEDAAKERVRAPSHQQLSNTPTSHPERPYQYSQHPNPYSPSRMPHDASVFVASLPSHLSDSELQTLLTEHLSHHATIKHVKLIRDNRNAICAFVQVQSAKQATELIENCNLSIFMDRQIRCERARAFRTLLVSWVNQDDGMTSSPQPLRLRRCRGSRFVQVTVGHDALCSDPVQLPNYSLPRPDDPLSGSGVFFESGIPEDDFETLKRLMEAFGPLEFMAPFDPKIHQADGEAEDTDFEPSLAADTTTNFDKLGPVGVEENSYELSKAPQTPCPANLNDGSSTKLWAIKWEHRNDAVSAVTALQSVTNLCVHWCHTHGRATGPTGGTGYTSHPSTPHHPIRHTAMTYRPRTFDYGSQWQNGNGYHHKQYQYHNPNYSHNCNRGRFNNSSVDCAENKSVSLPLSFSESDFPPLNGVINNNIERKSIGGELHSIAGFSVRTGMEYMGDGTPRKKTVENCGVWNGRKTFTRSNAPSPSPPPQSQPPPSPLSLPREAPVAIQDSSENMSTQIDFFRREAIPRTPDTPELEPETEGAEESASGVDMSPLTPGFPEAPHTPRSAYISSGNEKVNIQSEGFGKTNKCILAVGSVPGLQDNGLYPIDSRYVFDKTSSHVRHQSYPHSSNKPLHHQHHSNLNTHDRHRRNSSDQGRSFEEYTTMSQGSPMASGSISSFSDRELFVGNLKVESWSEERLRKVFGQYGVIEDLKFVKPGYNAPVYRRGFAFVRYADFESTQRAIQGQNMCSYDDHKIKVQLRDNHPNGRRSQWNYRGRGRFNQGRGYLSHEVDQSSGNTEDTPSTPKPLVTPTNQSPSKEMTLSADIVLKYPCITDPLSEENERALRHALDSGEDGTSPRAPSPGTTVDSLSPLTSLCLKSPEGPPRADSVRRSTQSEPDVQSPSSLNNTDVLSTYAPSSAGSAPASSNYHSHDNHCITNPWTPSLYPICTPVSQEYSHTRATVPAAQAVAPDGTFPWMGNMMPVVPWFNPPPGVELTSAPLRPTGYIQRDGIFIPVYPPERLDQYMSTNFNGSENHEQQAQSPSQASSTTAAVSPTGGNNTTPGLPRTSPTNTQATITSSPSWTVNGTHLHPPSPYPPHIYQMPYVVPPHAMMFSPHMTHPGSQGQWMPPSMVYPSASSHPHQQQHAAPTPAMAINGYPFYYPPQVNAVGNQHVHYSRSPYPGYYNTVSDIVTDGTPQVQTASNGVQTQTQQNQIYTHGKPGNGNRRDIVHNSRINGGNGRSGLGRRGNSLSGNGHPNGYGTSMGQFSKGTAARGVVNNTLPSQTLTP